MNREDIISMAREAGFTTSRDEWVFTEMLERFAALVAAAEREACAKVCEMTYEGAFEGSRPCFETPDECAAAIRAALAQEVNDETK